MSSVLYGQYGAVFITTRKKKIIKTEKRCRGGVPKSKQTRVDIEVNSVNIQSPIHPYIFSQYSEDVGNGLSSQQASQTKTALLLPHPFAHLAVFHEAFGQLHES